MSADIPDPWAHLGINWPDVSVHFERIGRLRGFTTWPEIGSPYIILNTRLTRVERRCTLAHETRHLERGMPCQGFRAQDENRVRAANARWLLPNIEVVAVASSIYDSHEAAESVWVTVPVLIDRMRGLNDRELRIMWNLGQVQAI